MKSGATETSFMHLDEYYKFPNNVFVSHLPEQLKLSDHQYKILWAHHAYDQQIFFEFDHRIVNHIVSPSEWNRQMFIRFHKVPPNKISVIPNGVPEIFSYSKYSCKKTKSMIYTSIPYKGLEILAKIIPLIHKKHPDTKFKIFSSMSLYGDDQLDNYIETYTLLKSLSNVEYSKAIPREELVKHYQEAAFFIHPNIWEETFCVSMTEAMRCGAFPIITDIGALSEVAGLNNAQVVPIEGKPTNKGYEVTENFINNFAETCCLILDQYDKDKSYHKRVSKNISDYVNEKYNWKTIAKQWESLIHSITGESITMATESTENIVETTATEQTSMLPYDPISAQQAVTDEEYLQTAFRNVLRWEESDKELAQGRTNFQLEKFIGLNTHNISVTFEHILKERRIMATGFMHKLVEMKQRVREFDWKWANHEDKTAPLIYDVGTEGGKKVLCWFDLEELDLTHYLKSSELEIRDRLHQMEHMDKMMDKLVEQNGGKPVTREQFLEENEEYWDARLAEQALDDLMASRTGISIGNIQAMRRASGPAIVDPKNELKEGYLPMDKLLSPQGKDEFVNDLQKKVLRGYEKLSGKDLGTGALKAATERKQIEGEKKGYYSSQAGEGFSN